MDIDIPNTRVKFRHLQCFLAVAHLGSVQRAADSLSITQPAVSKTIGELEDILGVRLFERGRRGATPTREGRLFAPHASACVAALREGVDVLMRESGDVPGSISIGILPTVAIALLPPALAAFKRHWPSVSVSVSTDSNVQLLARLKAGETDFVVGRVSDPEGMHGLSFEQIYREPLAVVVRAGHALSFEAPLMPTMLAAYPVVVPPFGTLIRQSAESVLTAFGAHSLTAFVETLSVSLGRALALHNDAVWFVPAGAVENDITLGLLTPLAMPFAGTDEPIGLVRRNDTARRAAEDALIEAIRDAGRARIGIK